MGSEMCIRDSPEADDNPEEIIKMISDAEIKAGIAIHPKVNITDIDHLFSKVQQIIVMTVTPGFCGKKFMHDQVQKIKDLDEIRKNNNYNYEIAVDGGVADISEEGITVLSERAEVLGSNASNKQIIDEKINALNMKLKKPEFQDDVSLKREIDFLNFVLEKSN